MKRTKMARLGSSVLFVLLTTSESLAQTADPPSAPAAAPTTALTGKAGGLTSDDVAKRASTTSYELKQKEHEIEAAEAELDRALIDYIPRVQVGTSFTKYSPVDSTTIGPVEIESLDTSQSVNAQLTIPISDYLMRLGPAYDAAKAQLEAAQHTRKAQEHKTAYNARSLYYAWVQAELEAAVAQQNLDLGNEHLARVKSLAAADSASAADVASVEANVAGAELVLVQAKNLVQLQRERIAIAMHDKQDGANSYQIGEDLSAAPAVGAPLGDVNRLVDSAYQKRPELGALRAQVTVYEEQADTTRAQGLPRLNATALVAVANPDARTFPQEDELHASWQLGLAMTYSPNDTASYLTRAAGTKAKARATEAEQLALRDAIRAEVVDAVLDFQNADANISISQRRLSAAETAYHARRERYLVDMATTVELSEAQTELFRARLDAVQAQVAVRVARAQLAYATGSIQEI